MDINELKNIDFKIESRYMYAKYLIFQLLSLGYDVYHIHDCVENEVINKYLVSLLPKDIEKGYYVSETYWDHLLIYDGKKLIIAEELELEEFEDEYKLLYNNEVLKLESHKYNKVVIIPKNMEFLPIEHWLQYIDIHAHIIYKSKIYLNTS